MSRNAKLAIAAAVAVIVLSVAIFFATKGEEPLYGGGSAEQDIARVCHYPLDTIKYQNSHASSLDPDYDIMFFKAEGHTVAYSHASVLDCNWKNETWLNG